MATNKNAQLRYQVLDRCFRNPGRKYFMDDLIEACNQALQEHNPDTKISRRQVFEDIKFMKSDQGWAVPLEHVQDGKKIYYRYTDITYSINQQPLNETEIKQIQAALQLIGCFKGLPQFEWVQAIIPRLNKSLGLINTDQEVISLAGNVDLKNYKFIGNIFNAIINQTVLTIVRTVLMKT